MQDLRQMKYEMPAGRKERAKGANKDDKITIKFNSSCNRHNEFILNTHT